MMTDPIADMLTRIRNASRQKFEKVDIPSSNVKVNIAKILKEEGYIHNYKVVSDTKQGILQVFLKYDSEGNETFYELQRISKPSIRRYAGKDTLPLVRNGLGFAIISTSRGIMTDKKARELGVGGEILCSVW